MTGEEIDAVMADIKADCIIRHKNLQCHRRGARVFQCDYHDGYEAALVEHCMPGKS